MSPMGPRSQVKDYYSMVLLSKQERQLWNSWESTNMGVKWKMKHNYWLQCRGKRLSLSFTNQGTSRSSYKNANIKEI